MNQEFSISIQLNGDFDFDFFVEEIKNWMNSDFFVKSQSLCKNSNVACLTIGCCQVNKFEMKKLQEWIVEVEKWLPSDSTVLEKTFDLSNGSTCYSQQKNITFSSMTGMVPSKISFKKLP